MAEFCASDRLAWRLFEVLTQQSPGGIRSATTAALQAKRARGERNGELRIGETVTADGKTLAPNPAEAMAIEMIARMRASGVSIRAIAYELNRCGVPARGGRWHATTVARIAARLP